MFKAIRKLYIKYIKAFKLTTPHPVAFPGVLNQARSASSLGELARKILVTTGWKEVEFFMNWATHRKRLWSFSNLMPQDEMTLQAAEKPQSVGSTTLGFFGGFPQPKRGVPPHPFHWNFGTHFLLLPIWGHWRWSWCCRHLSKDGRRVRPDCLSKAWSWKDWGVEASFCYPKHPGTPPKTNMEDDFPFQRGDLQVPC